MTKVRKVAAAKALVVLLVPLLLGLLGAATPRYVRNLDVAVETPVYHLPPRLPVPAGEQRYRLHWSGIPVAQVWLRMDRAPDRNGVEVEILGATHPALDWLWRYRFEGRGRVRTDPFAPGGFVVDECENREHQRTEIRFGESVEGGEPGHGVRGVRQVRGRTKEYVFDSDNTFDIPSAVFLVLNLDYAPGAEFAVDTFTGKSRYLVRIRVEGRDPVSLGAETLPAWRLRLETEELTDDDPEGRHRETTVWVSEERPRRLLRASSRTFVGAIHLDLEPDPGPDAPPETLRGARCV